MARQEIDIGSTPNDGTGDTLRAAGGKINDMTAELYAFYGKTPFTLLSTTSYTFALTDIGALLGFDAGPASITIPTNASVAFEVDDTINVLALTDDGVTITAASGVFLNGTDGGFVEIDGAYGVITFVKIDTDSWVAFGKIATSP